MQPKPQDIIIPVIFKSEIGQEGRNSRVYLAEEKNIGRTIIIKEIERQSLNINYFEEAIHLYQSKHPNVVELSYAGESSCKKYVYLAMPYYKSGSLNKKYNTGLTVRDNIKYALNFLSGLHSIHQKRLHHLDIKPDNILISEKNEALLSDFGLTQKANFKGLGKINPNKGLFTLLRPPELIYNSNQIVENSTDIYQAGVTLYSLVNQKSIEDYADEEDSLGNDILELIHKGKLYSPEKYAYHIPDKLKKIINKCLSVKPQNRPISVQALLNELSSIPDGAQLDWSYKMNSTTQSWDNKLLNISCTLTNNNIVIRNKNKITYQGQDLQKLLDLFK